MAKSGQLDLIECTLWYSTGVALTHHIVGYTDCGSYMPTPRGR
jgi:hypothetical protein